MLHVTDTCTERMKSRSRLLSHRCSRGCAKRRAAPSRPGAWCPFDTGTPPLNDWLRGERDGGCPPPPFQLKRRINQSYLKKPIHRRWRGRAPTREKMNCSSLLYLLFSRRCPSAPPLPLHSCVTIFTRLQHEG